MVLDQSSYWLTIHNCGTIHQFAKVIQAPEPFTNARTVTCFCWSEILELNNFMTFGERGECLFCRN